jgi:hypothetical protein
MKLKTFTDNRFDVIIKNLSSYDDLILKGVDTYEIVENLHFDKEFQNELKKIHKGVADRKPLDIEVPGKAEVHGSWYLKIPEFRFHICEEGEIEDVQRFTFALFYYYDIVENMRTDEYFSFDKNLEKVFKRTFTVNAFCKHHEVTKTDFEMIAVASKFYSRPELRRFLNSETNRDEILSQIKYYLKHHENESKIVLPTLEMIFECKTYFKKVLQNLSEGENPWCRYNRRTQTYHWLKDKKDLGGLFCVLRTNSRLINPEKYPSFNKKNNQHLAQVFCSFFHEEYNLESFKPSKILDEDKKPFKRFIRDHD